MAEFQCESCVFVGKNEWSLKCHVGKKHVGLAVAKAAEVVEDLVDVPVEKLTTTKTILGAKVIFFSPRRPAMTVVIRPDEWRMVSMQGGGEKLMQIPGLTVQFENGQLATKDSEIIHYLEDVYNDPRFPIMSNRQMKAMVSA